MKKIKKIFVVLGFGLHIIHGMEEISQISLQVPEVTQPVNTEKFFYFCLNNAIKQLARDDITTQNKIFFSQQDVSYQTSTINSLIAKMNFPTNFQYPIPTDENIRNLAELYTKTYNFLNLSLYPFSSIQQYFGVSEVKKIEFSGKIVEYMKYFYIPGIHMPGIEDKQNEKGILIYEANIHDFSRDFPTRLNDIQTSFNIQRIFLKNILFGKIAQIDISTISAISPDQIKILALLQDKEGQTLLHFLCENLDTISTHTESDIKNLIHSLLENGADPNILNSLGYTPLHILCNKDVKVIDRNLIEFFLKHIPSNKHKKQANPNIQDNNGNTPLRILCQKISNILIQDQDTRKKILKIINMLLRDQADPNLQNALHNTPLHTVCLQANDKNGYNEDVFELLIQNKANPNIKNKNNNTVLHSICGNNELLDFEKTKMIQKLFAQYDHKLMKLTDQNKDSLTPFFIACTNNDIHLALLLLQESSKSLQNNFFQSDTGDSIVLIKDYKNKTPLHYAVEHGSVKLVHEILINLRSWENNQQTKIYIDLKDIWGCTAAHYATLLFLKIMRLVQEFNGKLLGKKIVKVNKTWEALHLKSATEKNSQEIKTEQDNFIVTLQNIINDVELPQDIKDEKKTIAQYIKQFNDAREIYFEIFKQNGANVSLPDNTGETPQAIFDKYAPVVETALSIIAEKLGMEEAKQLQKLISPIPTQQQPQQVPVEQPKLILQQDIVVSSTSEPTIPSSNTETIIEQTQSLIPEKQTKQIQEEQPTIKEEEFVVSSTLEPTIPSSNTETIIEQTQSLISEKQTGQIPVEEQPTIKEEEEEEVVVVEQIQEKQSQTFWQKYKTIFAISSILAISVPILYKLYRKYRKQAW